LFEHAARHRLEDLRDLRAHAVAIVLADAVEPRVEVRERLVVVARADGGERELFEEVLAIRVVDDLSDERAERVEGRLRRAVEAEAARLGDGREIARRAGREISGRREERVGGGEILLLDEDERELHLRERRRAVVRILAQEIRELLARGTAITPCLADLGER